MADADAAALIDRFQVVAALQRGDNMRLMLAAAATCLLIAFNLWHPHQADGRTAGILAWGLAAVAAAVAVAGGLWVRWRWRQDLAALPEQTRLRVIYLAEAVQRRGTGLMVGAVIGHGVLAIGTWMGIGLLTAPGWPLAAALAPAGVAALAIGRTWPSRERLLRLLASPGHA